MTDNDIMEELSRGYLVLIANRSGYFNSNGRDYGTDLTIRKAKRHPERRRYLTIGKSIDIQIKAVSERYIRDYDNIATENIKYDLEVKAYNDLVERAKEGGVCMPLILVVFIVPNDTDDWLLVDDELLTVRKCAFWYKVLPETEHSNNGATVTISIPKANRISMEFYNEIFATLD